MTPSRATTGTGAARTDPLLAVLLAALTVAVYARIWTLGFVDYDDPGYVTDNPHVLAGLRWSGVVWAFTTNTEANWHPITWLSLMLDASIGGAAPGVYHTTNLALHIANTVLLFALLHRMTGCRWRSAAVAVLFAVHPLHVESVAWVAERKDVLSTLFWLLTVAAYVRWVGGPSPGRSAVLLATFAAGLMTKPMLVTLPLTLLLLDVWPLARWSRADAVRRVVEKLPLFALSAASAVVTLLVQRPAMQVLEAVPFPARAANALISLVAYAGQMLWPAGLAVIYPYPRAGIPLWQPIGAALLVGGVSAAALRSRERRPWLAVGWFFYLVTLVPVLGLVQVGYQARADRYTYVPLIGLFVVVAWGLPELVRSIAGDRSSPRGRAQARRRGAGPSAAAAPEHAPLLATVAALAIAVLSIRTWVQVGHWRSSIDLFTHAIRVTTDNAYAHYNLSTAYQERGDVERAVVHLREALRVHPRMAEAHFNLTRLLMKLGRLDEAAVLVAEEQAWWPSDPHTLVDLGVLAVLQGRTDDAIARFTEALRLAPDLPDARHNLEALLRDRAPDR
jgi:tetratricopeptide (TPR) repeat protein